MNTESFSYSPLLRFSLILEALQKRPYLSRDELFQYLQKHGFDDSESTFRRTLRSLREVFKIYIEYDQKDKGYYINEEFSPNLDSFQQFLDLAATAAVLNDSMTEPEKVLPYLDFEEKGRLRGIENFKPLLQAIRNKRFVNYTHVNYYHETRKHYRVMPFLLKEYYNRWYLVVVLPESKEYRTMGLDRIEDLQIESETFTYRPRKAPKDLFKDIVGLMYSEGKVENVLLAADKYHAKYIESLPLHRSQRKVKEEGGKVYFRYRLIPNYEFRQKVLAMDFRATVMEPKSLADEFKKTIKEMLNNYN